MAGIYIHIPFCTRKCHYCDFYSVTSIERQGKLLDALKKELAGQSDYLEGEPLRTVYLGGGTPSVYNPEQIQSVIDTVKELWDFSQVVEVTMEANPDDLTPEYLEKLARTDINRLSIGIQSFVDRDLRLMNRRHSAAQAKAAVEAAQRAGFGNITIDLIYGIPGMSEVEWKSNIEQALGLGVQHISAYHLTIEENTEMGRMNAAGKITEVGEDESEAQYRILHQMLCKAGFEHYEISNFALPGKKAAHNSSYWSGAKYLGIGPSAHSYNGHSRRYIIPSIEDYINGQADIYRTEQLSAADRYNEYVMVSLRTQEGVRLNHLREMFGTEIADMFSSAARRFVDNGTMVREGDIYRIPAEHFLISDSVISALFWSD